MTRAVLYATMSLLALSAAARAAARAAPAAPVVINGGGAASQQFDYAAPDVNGVPVSEMPSFDAQQSRAVFGTYWSTISGAAQRGLLNDDLSCISNAAQNINGGNCNGTVGGAETVHYAVSESVLSATQIAGWSTSLVGQSAAGNLIQLPMLGTGLAIVVNETNISGNGQITLSDTDLCEIFSGGYTDFSQITDSATAPAAGNLQLVYRADAAGTTFLLTNHLSKVCTSANTAPGVTFTATTSFATLFTNIGAQIKYGVGVSGLSNLANTLAGLAGGANLKQAISYISPDWTSVDSATSSARLSNGQPSPLLVAALKNGTTAYLPTAANILKGLTHIATGTAITVPATAAEGANPASWVPVIQVTSAGYPIVGYSTFEIPQCYAGAKYTASMIGFLTNHYDSAVYRTIQNNNGLVPVANGAGARLLAAIRQNILANTNGWNTNIGNPAACAGKAGR